LLDTDLGLLHTDDRLCESFIYDLLEPLRSKADVWALELLHKERMTPVWFIELRDGVVRLDPDLTRMLAAVLMPRSRKATLEIANDYAKRRLAREAPEPSEQRRGSWERSECGYCKEPLPRKGLNFCGQHCYLRYSIEVVKPIEKARQQLAELRAGGLSPVHGGEAALTWAEIGGQQSAGNNGVTEIL
jgi:hypothetical protein